MDSNATLSLRRPFVPRLWATGVLAGLAGGAAEIAWVALYAGLSQAEAAIVARGVTGSLVPELAAASSAVALGIAIHMALAVALGVAIAVGLRAACPRLAGSALEPVAVVGLLVAVWAANFFVVLPAINPAFVGLLPYAATLASKVLFGAAAAFVLRMRPAPTA